MGSIGWPEIIVLAILIVLLFGARRLPEIGKGIGDGIRNFRSAMRGDDEPPKSGGGTSGTRQP